MVCAHHWICDTPTGPVSKSTCRLCGEKKEFQNHLGGEQAEQLPYESGPAYLPEQRQSTRLEITEEPEVEPKPKDTRCLHAWHSGDPDEQGIAHIHCTLCPQEYWMDTEGNLYDSQKHMLSKRHQGIQPGEMVGRREKGAGMGRGGSQYVRSRELKPVREKAEELLRQGKTPTEVGRALAQESGEIPISTIGGWKSRMKSRMPSKQVAGIATTVSPKPGGSVPTQNKHTWLNETLALLEEMETERKDLSRKAAEIANQIEPISRGISGLKFIIQRYAEKHGNPTK